MKKIIGLLVGGLALAGIAAATPAMAGPASTSTPKLQATKLAAGFSPQGCGFTRVDSDGAGGWIIDWTNCWGNYTRSIATVWSNGKGNTYVNDGFCGSGIILASGQTEEFFIPANHTPGADLSNVTGVSFCLE